MSDKTFKDPVRLEVTNLLEGNTYVKDEIYEKETLLKWVMHQMEAVNPQYVSWRILNLEGGEV